MPSVLDIAEHILRKHGPMTAMKLQKLTYYAQAWHLVWEEEPLFSEQIQAWANGPVSPALYHAHRGQFSVSAGQIKKNPVVLTAKADTTVDAIISFYGIRSAMELSELTHNETPWSHARGDLSPGQRSSAVITDAAMAEYYGSL